VYCDLDALKQLEVALNENLELKTKEIGRGDEVAELQKENFRLDCLLNYHNKERSAVCGIPSTLPPRRSAPHPLVPASASSREPLGPRTPPWNGCLVIQQRHGHQLGGCGGCTLHHCA
jgi:hypothetical protein